MGLADLDGARVAHRAVVPPSTVSSAPLTKLEDLNLEIFLETYTRSCTATTRPFPAVESTLEAHGRTFALHLDELPEFLEGESAELLIPSIANGQILPPQPSEDFLLSGMLERSVALYRDAAALRA